MLVKSLFTEEERRQLAEECCRPLRTLTKEEIRRSEENKEQAIKANIERLKELNPESMHRLKRFNKDTNQFEIYSLTMIFALLHELGHLLCGVALGFKVKCLKITPLGFSVEFYTNIEEYNIKIKKQNYFHRHLPINN